MNVSHSGLVSRAVATTVDNKVSVFYLEMWVFDASEVLFSFSFHSSSWGPQRSGQVVFNAFSFWPKKEKNYVLVKCKKKCFGCVAFGLMTFWNPGYGLVDELKEMKAKSSLQYVAALQQYITLQQIYGSPFRNQKRGKRQRKIAWCMIQIKDTYIT